MIGYRIFVGMTATVTALVLVLTQLGGSPEPRAAPPELEPLPSSITSEPPGPSPSPEDDDPPQVDPAPLPFGAMVYQHDFSSPDGGLLGGRASDSGTNEFGSRFVEYTEGGALYVVSESDLPSYVSGAGTDGIVSSGMDLGAVGDVSIEVDATPVDLGTGATWGLACRRDRDVGRFFYAFVEDAGGHAGAGIIRQDEPGGEWVEIAREPALPSGVTVGAGRTNRLRLDCVGSRIALYVDGQLAVEGTDGSLAEGAAAVFVNPLAAGETASAAAEFDDLVVRA